MKFVFKPAGAVPAHDVEVLKLLLNAEAIEVDPGYQPKQGTPVVHSELGDLFLPLEGVQDVAAEIARQTKELEKIEAEIAIAEKNGDPYRPLTLRAYEAWVHFHAMDYAGVLAICQSVLPSVGATILSPWRRICLVLAGSAATG